MGTRKTKMLTLLPNFSPSGFSVSFTGGKFSELFNETRGIILPMFCLVSAGDVLLHHIDPKQ